MDQQRLNSLLQMYFIELPKLESAESSKGVPEHLANWVKFFKAKTEAELSTVSELYEAIREASEMLMKISQTPAERELYEMRRKALLDYNSNIRGARREGREEGKIELLLELARAKFGHLPLELEEKVKGAPTEQLQHLSRTILTVTSLDEWLG